MDDPYEEHFDLRFVKEHSSLEQDLAEFRKLYLSLGEQQKQDFKELIDKLLSVGSYASGLHELSFRIEIHVPGRWREDDWKHPYLRPRILKLAFDVWDRGEEFTPSTYEAFRDLNER